MVRWCTFEFFVLSCFVLFVPFVFRVFVFSIDQPFYLQPGGSKVQQQAQLETRCFDIVEGLYVASSKLYPRVEYPARCSRSTTPLSVISSYSYSRTSSASISAPLIRAFRVPFRAFRVSFRVLFDYSCFRPPDPTVSELYHLSESESIVSFV